MRPALEAIKAIGCSATWHIHVSSEGCSIGIGGFPVLDTFPDEGGMHTFFEVKGPCDLEACILRAANEYERTCYPERGRTWPKQPGGPEPEDHGCDPSGNKTKTF